MPSRVSYIFEESNGLLWLGTPAGLFRYDGIRLKRYNIFIDNPRQPSSASVLQLVEDDRHRLWLLTDKGLARYSVKEDCFVPYLKEGGADSGRGRLPDNGRTCIRRNGQFVLVFF